MRATSPSIIVIGAGLIGLSCADSLRKRGARVRVLERHEGPALATSFSNSGMVHPSQAMPWNAHSLGSNKTKLAFASVYDLAKSSASSIKKRSESLGLTRAAPPTGCYQIFQSETERDRRYALLQSLSVNTEIRGVELSGNTQNAIFFPDDYSGNAYDYCHALESDLRGSGVDIHYETSVERIKAAVKNSVEVVTQTEVLSADHVVIACGLHSQALSSQAGTEISLYPECGFALDFERPKSWDDQSPIMDAASRSALTVFKDRIRLSGTLGQNSSQSLLDRWTEIDPDRIEALGSPLSQWSSDRPMSTLGRPFIGPTATPGVWVNTGHGHMGWTLSAGSGELMARMICDGLTDSRFAA